MSKLNVIQDELSIECSDCVGICCMMSWDVAVTKEDVIRLDGLEYKEIQFKQIEEQTLSSGNHTLNLSSATPFAPAGHPPKGKYIGILPKKIGKDPVTGNPRVMCNYLGDDGRCTIYEQRPHACRSWGQVPCRLKIKQPT